MELRDWGSSPGFATTVVEPWASHLNSESPVLHLWREGLDLSPMSFPVAQPEEASVSSTLNSPRDIPLGPLGSAMVLGEAWHLHPVSPLCP